MAHFSFCHGYAQPLRLLAHLNNQFDFANVFSFRSEKGGGWGGTVQCAGPDFICTSSRLKASFAQLMKIQRMRYWLCWTPCYWNEIYVNMKFSYAEPVNSCSVIGWPKRHVNMELTSWILMAIPDRKFIIIAESVTRRIFVFLPRRSFNGAVAVYRKTAKEDCFSCSIKHFET